MPPIPPTRSPSLSGVLDSTKNVETASQGASDALDAVTKALLEATKALGSMPKGTDAVADALKAQTKAAESSADALKDQAKAAEGSAEALGTLGEAADDSVDSLDDFGKELKQSQTRIQRFTKDLTTKLGKLTTSALNSLNQVAGKLPGSRGYGPSGFGADTIDRGIGAAQSKLEGLGKLGGPAGVALEMGVRGALAAANARREAVVQTTQRALNYGFAEGDLSSEIDSVNAALTKASFAAAKFNGDLDATRSIIARVATQTGASFTEVGDNIERLERLRFLGVGSIEELSDTLIERMNLVGLTTDQALKEMEAITNEAVQIRAQSTDKFTIQMDDFYKAVRNVADSTDALTVNQVNLAKAMRVGLTAADKLNLGVTRSIKAAQSLTQALSSNYNEGFRTVEVYDDLQAAIAGGGEMAERAQKIQADLAAGRLTEASAARFLQESGFGTSEQGFLARAQRVAQEVAAGAPVEQIEARIGPISADVWELLKEITPQLLQGNVKSFADITTQSEAAKAGLDAVTKQLADAQLDPEKLMNATLSSFTAAAAKAFQTEKIIGYLSPISDYVQGLMASEKEKKEQAELEAMEELPNYFVESLKGGGDDAARIMDLEVSNEMKDKLLNISRKRNEKKKKEAEEAKRGSEAARAKPVSNEILALGGKKPSEDRATATLADAQKAATPATPTRAAVTPSQAAGASMGANGVGVGDWRLSPQQSQQEIDKIFIGPGQTKANGDTTATATVYFGNKATESSLNRNTENRLQQLPRTTA